MSWNFVSFRAFFMVVEILIFKTNVSCSEKVERIRIQWTRLCCKELQDSNYSSTFYVLCFFDRLFNFPSEGMAHGNVSFNGNGTMTSIPLHPLTWLPELSNGTEEDLLILPNIALLVSAFLRYLTFKYSLSTDLCLRLNY